MSNKANGSRFEVECCELLYRHGFWVHQLTQNAAGQPADIIAARNGKVYLIDAKLCSGSRFDLRRVEENQDTAMSLWESCGNTNALFFIGINDEIYVVKHTDIMYAKDMRGYRSLTESDCDGFGMKIERWLECS